jgi:hypothetical protein
MSATNIHHNQLAPHALFNHQAASKKSFRIRGQQEQEMMKNQANSSKDIGIMDFNNGKFIINSYFYRHSQIGLRAKEIACCSS